MDQDMARAFSEGIHSREPVAGLSHDFYRYPARFSPLFARAAIQAFTEPDDVVIDPFMGGGTTLVEARALGRVAVGVDINALSRFLVEAKTTILNGCDVAQLRVWGSLVSKAMNLRNPAKRPKEWIDSGYQKNLAGKTTWPTRKLLELGLDSLKILTSQKQDRIARSALLKTAQWALDCRTEIPSAKEFRRQLVMHLEHIIAGALEFRAATISADREQASKKMPKMLILNRSIEGLEHDPNLAPYMPPRLVLTSPPYPGVHVLYHRWQIKGRRETPAPYWIAGALDGNPASYYTFGDRKRPMLSPYFEQASLAFKSLSAIAGRRTTVVQLIGFSDPSWQLPAYISAMRDAGFSEIFFPELANAEDGRVWRGVPNRKWYARTRGAINASKEVVLFHRRESC